MRYQFTLSEPRRHYEWLGLIPLLAVIVAMVIAPDSSSSEGYRLLGRAYDGLGETASAVTAFKEALVRDDGDVWAMNKLAMVYIGEGQFEDALGPLARATQLAPEVATFQNNLGIALERTGHVTAAVQA